MWTAASLLAVVAAGTAAATSTPVRGVPSSLAAAYAGPRFTCLDGSKTIAAEEVNDDYCHCGDGSDEPGTAACPNGRFYCVNKSFRGKYVPSSLVNDGVCDCCDGSDEYATPRSGCKNTCEADGASWRAAHAEAIRKAEEGARLRTEYAAAGQRAATERKAKLEASVAALEKAAAVKEAAEKVRRTV